MLNNTLCDLCGKSDATIVYPATVDSASNLACSCACTNDGHGKYHQVVRCKNCGLYYCSPRPDSQLLEQGYGEVEDELYHDEEEGRRRTFRGNLGRLTYYKKKGKLLDVGCALGIFIDEASKLGWDAEGIEPSKWCVEKGKEFFNLKIRQGSYKNLSEFDYKFDVITMWDVLEHVDEPSIALRNCRDILEDDGILVFSTVNIGSLYARMLGRKWPWFMEMHLYYFDLDTIRKYLEKAGFMVLDIKKYSHTVSIDYLSYKLKKISIVLYKITNFLRKAIFPRKKIFLTLGMGDFIEVYAKKQQN